MLAFLMEELRGWSEGRMRRDLIVSSLVIAIPAAASLLQPMILALIATALFLVLGWSSGNRYQSAKSSRRLLISFPARPGAVAAGKALSSAAIWLLMAAFLAPPILLSAIAWGISGSALAACCLSWLIGYLAVQGLGFLSSLVFSRSDGLPGVVLLVLAFAATFALKPIAISNPFVQVWTIMKGESGLAAYLGMGAGLVAAAALQAAAALALARIRRRGHD
jgi:hypothetical protein